jgi:hypothetical protein
MMPTLLQVSDLHISNFSKMVDKKLRSRETLKQWNATRKKIEEFLVTQYKLKDMELEVIDYSFAVKFYNYLTIDREKVLGEAVTNPLNPLLPVNIFGTIHVEFYNWGYWPANAFSAT